MDQSGGTYISKVNYKNMIQNLADMYSFNVDEVVLVECIANSLDAKASKIVIDFDPQNKILSISDNGKGMDELQFKQYHDFAMGLKTRGKGIGFAGLGAKISFNIADRVLTETRSKNFSGGSDWRFNEDGDLIWKPVKCKKLDMTGTTVKIYFNAKAKVRYRTVEDIKKILFRHYAPLFDEKFLEFYKLIKCYESSPRFIVNGVPIEPVRFLKEYQMSHYKEFLVKTPGKNVRPIGYAFFGLVPEDFELEEPGVLLCTWGKVIKPDFFNQFPGELMSRIFGIAEIPNFVKFLTTSKSDFNRRKNPKEFNMYYQPLRNHFVSWLKEQGIDKREEIKEEETRELEREIFKIIKLLPEVSELVSRWDSKKVYTISPNGKQPVLTEKGSQTFPEGEGEKGITESPKSPDPYGHNNAYAPSDKGTDRAESISRKAKVGLKVSFKNVPEQVEIGWVDGDIVYINSGHPAYVKTAFSKKSRLVFNLVAVATALQRHLRSESDGVDMKFVDKFLSAWGK